MGILVRTEKKYLDNLEHNKFSRKLFYRLEKNLYSFPSVYRNQSVGLYPKDNISHGIFEKNIILKMERKARQI